VGADAIGFIDCMGYFIGQCGIVNILPGNVGLQGDNLLFYLAFCSTIVPDNDGNGDESAGGSDGSEDQ